MYVASTNTPHFREDDHSRMTFADRTKRVKDARSEAQKEIEDYRKQKEEEFKKFETEVGSPSSLQAELLFGSQYNKKDRGRNVSDTASFTAF